MIFCIQVVLYSMFICLQVVHSIIVCIQVVLYSMIVCIQVVLYSLIFIGILVFYLIKQAKIQYDPIECYFLQFTIWTKYLTIKGTFLPHETMWRQSSIAFMHTHRYLLLYLCDWITLKTKPQNVKWWLGSLNSEIHECCSLGIWRTISKVGLKTHYGRYCTSNWVKDSVNRLGDLLDFGQVFKGFGSN